LFVFSEPILRIWLRRMDPALPGALRLALLGAYLSLLGVPAYYALLGLNRAGTLFWSHVVQSATNAAVVLVGVWIGHQVSLSMLLVASAIAMGASTCFLTLNYRASRRSLGIPHFDTNNAGISDVSVGAARS
jgi:O-antigen/teichoic acid export membrane protein